MKEPFSWERDRRSLTVMPAREPGAVNFHAYDSYADKGIELDIPPHEVAGLAKALALSMHETAGLPAPVILDRPKYPSASLGIGVGFAVRPDGKIEVTRQPQQGVSGSAFHPDGIRDFAAGLAILADEAENEPDPAEVEALAELMDAEMMRRDNGQSGLYPACARIALRWMREREAKP